MRNFTDQGVQETCGITYASGFRFYASPPRLYLHTRTM